MAVEEREPTDPQDGTRLLPPIKPEPEVEPLAEDEEDEEDEEEDDEETEGPAPS
jgi:hypothetical protein